MLVQHSYDHRFVAAIERIRKETGEEMFELSGIGEKQLDINNFSKKFYSVSGESVADKTIDANANVNDNSVNAWQTEGSKPLMKLNAYYQLWKFAERKHGIKRANKMLEAEIKGAIRIHDAHVWDKPYCWAASLQNLVNEGMPFWEKPRTTGINHFDSFINVSLQYVCYLSNQIAGAVALPDFFVYAEYFIRKDYGENWFENESAVKQINQLFQNWIFSVNFSWRSNQSPFTNLSVFDREWLKALFAEHYNPDFSQPDFDNVMRVQKMFTYEMLRNLENNPFTFPVMTSCLLYDKEKGTFADEEFFDWVSEIQAESGLFNMFHDSDINALSSCCRLRNNIEDANREYMNSFGAGGLSIGSHRVVTLNLPQIAFLADGDWTEFMKLLEYRVNLSQDILDIHRETIQQHIDNKRLPLYTFGFMNLDKQFSTIGFIGLNEAIEIMGQDILDEEGNTSARSILNAINLMNDKRSKKDGHIRNLEQIPGESAAVTFAKKDKLLFESMKHPYKLYSNQYIPLVKHADINERLRMQGLFDQDTSGGAICHINVNTKLTKEQFKIVMKVAAALGVVYWAVNYGLSQCKSCGKTYVGQYEKSPCHDADVDKYLRVVGFMTNVKDWIKERREEHPMRQFYDKVC